MYFPYLRGRQFELIGLRELLNDQKIGNKIVPIIEPIKPTVALLKTMSAYSNVHHPLSLVMNPAVGKFIAEYRGLNKQNGIALGLAEETAKESLIKAYILKKGVAKTLLKDPNKGNYLIVCDKRDMADEFLEVYENEMPRYTLIPKDRVLQRVVADTGVLFENYFHKCVRNMDYEWNDDEFFSDAHLTFTNDGFLGFGDYSIVGEEFTESGFAPLAVAIHIAYFNSKKELRIKHFVSDSNIDINDPANKFKEALIKLIEWCDLNKLPKTSGLQELYDCYYEGHYPGLGVVKKCSIKHHIEMMNMFLEGKI